MKRGKEGKCVVSFLDWIVALHQYEHHDASVTTLKLLFFFFDDYIISLNLKV